MTEPHVYKFRVNRRPYEYQSYADGCEAMIGLPSGIRLHCRHCGGDRMLPPGVMANDIDYKHAPPVFGHMPARITHIEAFRLRHQGCGRKS